MDTPKIAIILGSRFPTQKAYGITTLYTISSLLKKTKNVKIFCLQSNYQDVDFRQVDRCVSNLRIRIIPSFFMNISFKDSKIYNKVFFRLGIFIILIDNIRLLRTYNPEIIWVRDPLIAFMGQFILPRSKIILEVHSSDSIFFLRLLVKSSSRVTFFPINNANQMLINMLNPEIKSILAPMAIDTINFLSNEEIAIFLDELANKRLRNLKIGYVGSISPQGYSKGIEDLISLASLNQDLNNMNEVNLVGCTDAQINYYSNLQLDRKISTTYLKFLPHINHTAALKIMKNYDILVLPMPINTSYNGMPLKLLEYLSSGRITIIAENDLLKPIFGSQFKPYWYLSGDENSLYKMIKLAIQDENLQNNIQQGIEFARQFTWEARTDNILKSLNTEL